MKNKLKSLTKAVAEIWEYGDIAFQSRETDRLELKIIPFLF